MKSYGRDALSLDDDKRIAAYKKAELYRHHLPFMDLVSAGSSFDYDDLKSGCHICNDHYCVDGSACVKTKFSSGNVLLTEEKLRAHTQISSSIPLHEWTSYNIIPDPSSPIINKAEKVTNGCHENNTNSRHTNHIHNSNKMDTSNMRQTAGVSTLKPVYRTDSQSTFEHNQPNHNHPIEKIVEVSTNEHDQRQQVVLYEEPGRIGAGSGSGQPSSRRGKWMKNTTPLPAFVEGVSKKNNHMKGHQRLYEASEANAVNQQQIHSDLIVGLHNNHPPEERMMMNIDDDAATHNNNNGDILTCRNNNKKNEITNNDSVDDEDEVLENMQPQNQNRYQIEHTIIENNNRNGNAFHKKISSVKVETNDNNHIVQSHHHRVNVDPSFHKNEWLKDRRLNSVSNSTSEMNNTEILRNNHKMGTTFTNNQRRMSERRSIQFTDQTNNPVSSTRPSTYDSTELWINKRSQQKRKSTIDNTSPNANNAFLHTQRTNNHTNGNHHQNKQNNSHHRNSNTNTSVPLASRQRKLVGSQPVISSTDIAYQNAKSSLAVQPQQLQAVQPHPQFASTYMDNATPKVGMPWGSGYHHPQPRCGAGFETTNIYGKPPPNDEHSDSYFMPAIALNSSSYIIHKPPNYSNFGCNVDAYGMGVPSHSVYHPHGYNEPVVESISYYAPQPHHYSIENHPPHHADGNSTEYSSSGFVNPNFNYTYKMHHPAPPRQSAAGYYQHREAHHAVPTAHHHLLHHCNGFENSMMESVHPVGTYGKPPHKSGLHGYHAPGDVDNLNANHSVVNQIAPPDLIPEVRRSTSMVSSIQNDMCMTKSVDMSIDWDQKTIEHSHVPNRNIRRLTSSNFGTYLNKSGDWSGRSFGQGLLTDRTTGGLMTDRTLRQANSQLSML